jgi:hypothetical protein
MCEKRIGQLSAKSNVIARRPTFGVSLVCFGQRLLSQPVRLNARIQPLPRVWIETL